VDNAGVNPIMTRKSWLVVLWLSALLEQTEQNAVLGDLAECGDSSGRAIKNVLGLVLRRRVAVLWNMRLWAAFVLLILPVGFLLSEVAQTRAGLGSLYCWMYLNNWDWALTRNPGFWFVLRETALQFTLARLLLVGWSWSAGFLIGRLPDPILRASRNAFIVLLALSHFHGLRLRPSLPDPNAPVTANVFYHMFFPWIVLATLVILPVISGIRQGNRSLRLGRKMRVVLVAAAVASLVILLVQAPSFGLLFGPSASEWQWRNRALMQALSWLACWPMLDMIATSFRRSLLPIATTQ
jgi:hypothetical protein